MPSMRRSFFAGMRDFVPLLLGALPFGLVLGVTVAASTLPNLAGWSSSWLIFGGSAQLASITLLAAGSPAASAVTAALVVNARHLMYSAAMVPRFRRQPRWFRWVGPYFLIDQVFALVSVRDDPPDSWRAYYLGAGMLAWTMWLAAVATGILLGATLPSGLSLEFAIPVLFIGLFVPALVRRPAVVAVVVAVLVTALLHRFPNRAGMLVGAVAGMMAGILAERAGPR
ncbi:MAG: AzlC family ABC transporter permease [Acidimicrobiia bacterium]|jgi:4-azaleucine resistance transporter AzlC